MQKLIAGLDSRITDPDLLEITSAHSETWRSLPPYLELPNTIVGDIERTYTDEDKRRIEFFKVWKEIKDLKATYRSLIYALCTVKKKCEEDAESITRLLLKKSLPTHSIQQTGASVSEGKQAHYNIT